MLQGEFQQCGELARKIQGLSRAEVVDETKLLPLTRAALRAAYRGGMSSCWNQAAFRPLFAVLARLEQLPNGTQRTRP